LTKTEIKKLKQSFYSLTLKDLKEVLSSQGFASIHAGRLFKRVYQASQLSTRRTNQLPKVLEDTFTERFDFSLPQIVEEDYSSCDGSVKITLKLVDKTHIEMVLMPEKRRLTLCLSSQVGCRQRCVFCHTGKMGLIRQMKTSEIIGQVIVAKSWLSVHRLWLENQGLSATTSVTNIVFMGMGEPLDNIDPVLKTMDIMLEPFGLHLAKRRITISTAGHLPGLKQLLHKHPDVHLAFSLHHPDPERRMKILPIERLWPASVIFDTYCKLAHKKNSLMIQYTMISEFNDQPVHAYSLISLVSSIETSVKINLIPLNPTEHSRLSVPSLSKIKIFQNILHQQGIRTMIRYSKGQDIQAACGQLAIN